MPRIALSILPGRFAVCRLNPDAEIREQMLGGHFLSVTRTDEELSVVCAEDQIPPDAKSAAGWRCLKVQGPLDFSMTGVLASLTAPLAEAEISVFAISTYDTDYLFVKEEKLGKARAVLSACGLHIESS